MKEIQLKARGRSQRGRRAELSALRAGRLIPAVVYGGDKPPVSVSVAEVDLAQATRAGGANAIIHLEHPQGSDTVILKELKRHVVTNRPLHADFQRISLKRKIEVKVPIKLIGEPPGVRLHGGILEHVLRELRIRSLPAKIPHHVEVDVGALEINESIHVRDLRVPEDVEVLDGGDHLVANVIVPTAETEAPTAEAAAAAAEPEVIAKGKKEEGEAAGAETKAAAAEKKKEAAK